MLDSTIRKFSLLSLSSSPFGGTPSSPTFTTSMPAFDSSLTPFRGSTCFAEKPASGGFGSTPTQTNPFGSATQPSIPAFGSSIFGSSTPFGASSQPTFGLLKTPTFGATSTPTFGATSTPGFGATSTSAFGATSAPIFGSTCSAFGVSNTRFGGWGEFGGSSNPIFGSTSMSAFGTSSSPFGASSSPAFGASTSSTPAFGFGSTHAFAQSSSAFGSSSPFGSTTSAFGAQSSAFDASSTPAFSFGSTHGFGQSSSAFGCTSPFGSTTSAFGGQRFAFGASSTPTFSFGSTHAFGQSSSAFGSTSPFGSTTSAFGGQSSAFGLQTPTLAFGNTSIGQSRFGGQRGGSRVASYLATIDADGGTSGHTAKLESISAMPVYKDKSHEALRWEDYQLGDKGLQTPTPTFGNTCIGQSGFGGQRGGSRVASYSATIEADCTFGKTAKLESISAMPVYKDKSHEELRREDYQFGDKGLQTPTPTFGNTGIVQSGCGGQRGGSRVATYSTTIEADRTFGQTAKLESISAMPVYKDKSHEELRWEDYQLGDKGGPLPSAQSTGLSGFSSSTTATNVFSPSPPGFGQSSANPFSSTTPNPNPFAPKTSTFSFGFGPSTSTAPSTFGSSTSAATPSIFGPSTSPFGKRLKFEPASESDRQQRNNSTVPAFLQVNDALLVRSPKREKNPAFWYNNVPTAAEDLELAMAINESIQYALQKRPTFPDAQPNSGASSSTSGVNTGTQGSSCVMCLDAPAEGACVPCGHVAGCMSCLNVVKTKKRRCPICRANIDQIIKLYHV